MKRLVSLLAIALVSSLFAAGCGKLKKCGEATAKGQTFCETDSNFENVQCMWDADKCVDLVISPEDQQACAKAENEEACKTKETGTRDIICKWEKNSCVARRAPKKK